MKKILAYLSIFLIAIALTGCGQPQPNINYHPENDDLVYVSYSIVNKLENSLKAPISPDDPIIVASFVDVKNLKKSSTFGRIMAEQVGSRLAQKGYKVIEMKLRHNSVFVQEGKGEFLLSRDLKAISNNHNASAVVVGTYGRIHDRVYVSARIVNPKNSVILASFDYGILLNAKQMHALMKD
ncbi:FlgO family outer membrane protein [Desulfobacula phenolica]|uniref:TolB amino-terminal domain-containing protein n=1 Tax=Desulfobacula phenolica TaxID=90732 RepID=A0A1H2K7M9_9BACT|nr:FlgO family outer membrane protein [Desulfobacula phenolica]SDU64573.1 TolB amino-terminal domain-containing protein [Desulfobacula phenolica]